MKDKVRDMVRSILPSTARKSARDGKKFASRKARHAARQQVHEYDWEDEDDDLSGPLHEVNKENRLDIRTVVRNRRNADKIGPFVRWAEEKTKNIPEEEAKTRRDIIAGEIDAYKDVITKHALGHFVPDYQLNPVARNRFRRDPMPPMVSGAQLREAIQKAFEDNHRKLNKVLRYMRVYPCGYHNDLYSYGAYYNGIYYPGANRRSQGNCFKETKQEVLTYTYRQIVKQDSVTKEVLDTFMVKGSITKPDPKKVVGEVQAIVSGYRDVWVHDDKTCEGFFLIKDHQSLAKVLDHFGKDVYYYNHSEMELLLVFLVDSGVLVTQDQELLALVETKKNLLHRI